VQPKRCSEAQSEPRSMSIGAESTLHDSPPRRAGREQLIGIGMREILHPAAGREVRPRATMNNSEARSDT
jgi:hypothetical protein